MATSASRGTTTAPYGPRRILRPGDTRITSVRAIHPSFHSISSHSSLFHPSIHPSCLLSLPEIFLLTSFLSYLLLKLVRVRPLGLARLRFSSCAINRGDYITALAQP